MTTLARKAQPGQIATLRLTDFSGGWNSMVSPPLLSDKEGQVAKNVFYDQKGTLTPRKGRKKRYANPIESSPVLGLGAYYRKDGTSRLLIALGTSLYYDEPHMEDSFDTQAQWEEGTVEGKATTTRTSGSLRNDGSAASNAVQETDTDAEWNAGTLTDVQAASNTLKLVKDGSDTTYTKTSQADFQAGTLTQVDSTTTPGSLLLARQP